MPKKKVSTKPKKRDHALRLTIVVMGSFLLLVGLAAFLQYKPKNAQCANSISCISDLSGKKEENNEGVFMGQKVVSPEVDDSLYALSDVSNVLGETSGDYKRIQVDLTNQRLYAFEGTTKIFDFPVSTGKWNKTPTGDFRIWIWLRYTRMSGGNQAAGTYYNLPNVPYTMYYYNDVTPKAWGYSLHGAYWHDNFGNPMSHGCVNMRIEDAGKIFYWTNPLVKNVAYATAENPGTLITVYGTTPNR